MSGLFRWSLPGLVATVLAVAGAERINHEGRILGPAPAVTNAIVFNTPEADAVVASMQIFPRDNAWNEDISRRPVLTNSDAMMAQIISDLATNRRTAQAFYEMNFVLVPDTQPLVPIGFDNPPEFYPDECDPSPYPFATNTPVETWPRGTGSQTLRQWQTNDDGSDRHCIAVMPGSNFIWETWRTVYTNTGPTNWHAGTGAKFNMANNSLRPAGWTSADAGGLSMFAGLARYDECQRGMVEHAIRLIVKRTRREYIYPATHYASTTPAASNNVPAMGQRLRLKAGFNIPTNWSTSEEAVLRALKKYGAIVADNGGFFSISVAPDQRFSGSAFANFNTISLTNFEVVQTTGASQGPRSPGAPSVNAGNDQTIPLGNSAILQSSITYTAVPPLALQWRLYSGPAAVQFSATNQTNTTVNFSAPGTYTFLFSADDAIHTVAYDAVIVTVTPAIRLNAIRSGTNVTLRWSGGAAPFQIERTVAFNPTNWSSVLTTNGTNATFPANGSGAFYRVQGQ